MPTPAFVQAFAYFPALRNHRTKLNTVAQILAEAETCGNRAHLIRHRDWWNDPDHANALDEIVDFGTLTLEGPSSLKQVVARVVRQFGGLGEDGIQPEDLQQVGVSNVRVLAHLNDEEQCALVDRLTGPQSTRSQHTVDRVRQLTEEATFLLECRPWPDGGEELRPPPLLARLREASRRRTRGVNIPFAYLHTLPDGRVDNDGCQLRVLRDSWTLNTVAKQLHNCAVGYTDLCTEQGYLFVARFDADGCPTALGGYVKRAKKRGSPFNPNKFESTGGNAEPWGVDQVVGLCNQSPPRKVREVFDEFLRVVLDWGHG